jgi:hypothetical protein
MNESDKPGPLPPVIPASAAPPPSAGDPPLGTRAGDTEPIRGCAAAFEAVLREPRRVFHQLRQGPPGALIVALALLTVICSLGYGLVAGTFSGGTQLWAAPLKVAGGLLFAALICFPSLFVFACLGGAPARVGQVAGLLAGMLAVSSMLLIGLAPVAWVFSQSTESVAMMGALHLVFWGLATCFGLRFMDAGLKLMLNAGAGTRVWFAVFVLVALQMTTALRPIIGTAETLLPAEKKFFLVHWLETIEQSVKPQRHE